MHGFYVGFTICTNSAKLSRPGGWTTQLRDFLAAIVEEDEEDAGLADGAATGHVA